MRKKFLIGLLTIGMVLQSVSVPVLAAPSDAVVTETVVTEAEFGESEDDKSDSAADEKPDGTDESKPDEGTEEKPDRTDESKPGEGIEEEPDGADESKPDEGTEEEPDGTGNTKPGESTGEESDESGEDMAEDPDESDEMPEEEPESISANQLSVSEEGQEELLTEYVSGDLYQEGSFDVVVERSGSLIAPMADASSIAEAEAYIYEQLLAKEASIDVSKYQIPESEIKAIVLGVINDHPELYFVRSGFYSNSFGGIVDSVAPMYIDGLDDAAFKSGLDSALASVDSGMTDLEKAIALHDYLAVNCEYDYDNYLSGSMPQTSFSAYGALVNRMAVCQGYALAYKLLLGKVGITSYMVTSDEMNHAWNLIELDGKYYQVDVTWDDPTRDLIGRVSHTYMFCSDAGFTNHHDWQVTSGSEEVGYTAVDTSYDTAFWKDSNSPLVILGSDCYYIYSSNLNIRKASLANVTNRGTKIGDNIAQWYTWDGTGYYTSTYSGLFCVDNRLYYNDPTRIYSIALDGTDKRIEFKANTANGFIYGSAFCQGKVLYCLHQSPNLTEKENVLTAQLSGGVGEPDIPVPGENEGALNLDNLSAEYTTTDGEKISSTADGKPKLLIFYSNGCANSKNTIRDISRNIGDYAGGDVYAIETDKGTKESVEEFKENYGCSGIAFSYDTDEGNSASMWEYVSAAGLESPVSWPVICYIDADNRLQYVTKAYITSAEVLSNLKKYCNAEVEVPQIYKITYILNGGTNSDLNPVVYTSESDTIVLEDADRDGYRFAGWYRDSACTIRVTRIEQGSKGNKTLYAKWSPVSSTDLPEIDMTPASGNVVMGFSGAYYTETADKILKRLNAIRLEACKEGVQNPSTGQPLTVADYVPLKWSSDLEAIARLRAAEATVNQAHTRPNGKSCFTVKTTNGEQSYAENLAWNYSGLMEGIEQWYGEKNDWVKQTQGAVTGHYTSIISPSYQQVAVGAFRLSSGGWYAVAQEFSYKNTLDEQKNADHGNCVQYMEVQGSKVTKLAYGADKTAFLQAGDSCRMPVKVTAQYKDYYGSAKSFTGPYQIGGSWSSSNEAVAVVDDIGEVTALAKGTTQISMTAGTKSVSTQITVYGSGESPVVVKSPNRTTYKVGQKINLAGGTVTYPSGSQVKTVTLAAGMISGFDSTNPGICTVQVATAGYTTSFDTLIVEEPKLTVPAGKRLSEVALPQNAHGTYKWQDDTAVMEKAGIYTFTAEFTPNETKFQKLTVQVQVTAQETLGADTDVNFKTNRFTYNGTEQEPKVVVRASDTVLKEGQDYELSYENNKNAGTATVTVVGKGCYLSSVSRTFEIKPAQLVITAQDKAILIGDPVPALNEYQYEVSGLMADDALITEPVVLCGIEGESSTAAGQYDIVFSGAAAGDNYIISYVNGKLTVASEYVSCTVRFNVQEHGTAPADVIDVKVGSTINKPADPAAEGYRFDGWYWDAACTKAWNFDTDIVQSDMTLYAKWLGGSVDGEFAFQEIADVYYTGKACKPAVSVYDGDTLLKSGRDYQIKYYNNTNANKNGVRKQGNGEGEYFNAELPYVEIIGKGNYTDRIKDGNKDTVKVNFNILRTSIGDGTENPAAGVTLKVSEQLVTAKKVQKPFSSVKYVKGMKRDTDFCLHLTVENARDQSGKNLAKDLELDKAEIPAGYEGEFLLTVEGIGNYAGSIRKTIYVSDKTHLIKNTKITLGKNLKNIVFEDKTVELKAAETDSPDTFTVKYGKTILKPICDYTVSYRNNNGVGKAELIITGNGEYVGTKTVTFNIKGKTFSAKTVQVSGIENKVYTGRALTQNDAVLTYGTKDEAGKPLQYGTDYTITYAKNMNKGSATMTFKGVKEAGYSGSFKKTFKITAADIADTEQVKRAAEMDGMIFSYCKAGVKPVEQIVLTNKEGFALRNGKDYTLKYTNNKAVADASAENPPTVTVQGKGNYTGKFDVAFQITKSDLKRAVDDDIIKIKTTAVVYNPKKAETFEYKPAIKLMDGKSALRAGTDYEITYLNNTQADYESYIQRLKDKSENEGSESGNAGSEDEEPASGKEFPRAVITEKEGSSYRLDGQIVVPLPIYEEKMTKSKLKVTVGNAVYSGEQVIPTVSVYYLGESGEILLVEGVDYTLSYGANVKTGKNKGSVKISGIAPRYGGDVTVKFNIDRKAITY